MSSAVGLNLLPTTITTTTNVVPSPLSSQNETSNDTSNIELSEKNISNCHQKESITEESDTNHNSEQNEGM